jgi:predicted transcriptional regulator
VTAPKQLVKKIVDSLPEDTSYDEILKELAFNKMIQKGLKDSKEGKVISNKEMKKRIQSW